MYTIIYNLYFKVFYLNKKYNEKNNFFFSFLVNLFGSFVYHFFNVLIPVYYRMNLFQSYGLNKEIRDRKVIVSLTSFPKRIDTVWLTIESIMRQNYKADKIILWLAKSQFKDDNDIPYSLQKLKHRGLEIKFCEDIKSHKKYYFSMISYPEDIIITIDDDMFYHPHLIKNLMELYVRYPNDIICSSTYNISPSYKVPPSKWKDRPTDEVYSSTSLCINSGAGTLFPPNALSKEAFNIEKIMDKCPYADDLWLTVQAYLNNRKITSMKYRPYPITIRSSQEESLYKVNTSSLSHINNDTQWMNLITYYKNILEEFMS